MHSARALNFLHLNSTQGVTRKHHHIIVPDASIHDHLSPCLDRRYIHISSLFCMLLSMAAAAWGFVYLPCDFVSYPFTRSLSLSSPPWLRTISSPPRLHLLHLHIWLSANGALSGNEQQSMYGQPVVMFLSDLVIIIPTISSLHGDLHVPLYEQNPVTAAQETIQAKPISHACRTCNICPYAAACPVAALSIIDR